MTNLESILKNRDITLSTKVPIVKDMVFPVVTYIRQSWTIKEGWVLKNWCFWTVVLEKTLRVPWTARRSNQSILKEINPKYSLEGLMLKLKPQHFGHLMQKVYSLEKPLMLGKIEGRRRRGWQDEVVGWHHWLNGHEFEQALGDSEGQGSLACCHHGVAKHQTWLSDWTTNNCPTLFVLGSAVRWVNQLYV